MQLEISQKFATVRELSELFPCFSESSLRYLIFNSQNNGLNICLRKIGKKVLINVGDFEAWIENHKVSVGGVQ